MYPSKRKYKTKVQHVDSPRFNECFKVSRVPPEDVEQMGCRIRFVILFLSDKLWHSLYQIVTNDKMTRKLYVQNPYILGYMVLERCAID